MRDVFFWGTIQTFPWGNFGPQSETKSRRALALDIPIRLRSTDPTTMTQERRALKIERPEEVRTEIKDAASTAQSTFHGEISRQLRADAERLREKVILSLASLSVNAKAHGIGNITITFDLDDVDSVPPFMLTRKI